MPDRIFARGLALKVLGWVVIVLMLAAGVTATVFAYNGANAVKALKTSSSRSECRTRIVNEDEDAFRHRIGDALRASYNRDPQTVAQILTEIQHAEPTQARIDRECPAPLVNAKENR